MHTAKRVELPSVIENLRNSRWYLAPSYFLARVDPERTGARFLWQFNDFTELLVTQLYGLLNFLANGARMHVSHFHSFAGENKQPSPGNYANREIKGIDVPDERSWISEAPRTGGRITFGQM